MRYLYLFVVGAMLASCSSEPQNQNPSTLPDGTLPTLNSSTGAPAGLTVNPAHGQPGHDCALPVGAPLNASTTPTVAPAPAPVPTPAPTPAPQTSSITQEANGG